MEYRIKGLRQLVLHAHRWTGRRKLTEEDLGLPGGTLPPEELADLGRKWVFNPERLKPFRQMIEAAERLLDQVAIRFMGGYAVPESRYDEVLGQLKELEKQFATEKAALLADYHAGIEAWAQHAEAKKAGFGEVVRRAAQPKEHVSAQLDFWIETMDDAESSAGNSLLDEVARSARDLLRAWSGRDLATGAGFNWRSFTPIRPLRDKLASMAFLHHAVQPAVDRLDKLLADVPTGGVNDPELFRRLVVELSFLSDPENVKAFASASKMLAEADKADAAKSVSAAVEAAEREAAAAEPEAPIQPAPSEPEKVEAPAVGTGLFGISPII